MRILLSFMTILALAGCTSLVDVPKVEDHTPIAIPADAKPSPFGLFKIKSRIPRGQKTGAISPRGLGCGGPWGLLTSREITKHIEQKEFRDAFNGTMESLGYDVTVRDNLIFDEDYEDDVLRTLYSVGASITDIKMDLCNDGFENQYAFSRSVGGEAYMKVEWGIYDRLNRKTIYKTTTEGYSTLELGNDEGVELLLDDAFASASHNLGSDPIFHDLMVRGITPQEPEQDIKTNHYTNTDPVYLDTKPASKTPLKKTMDQSRKAAVLISAGVGHGSGFFISEAGHILTNQHVVGNAEKVRIETAEKKNKLIGTVLRRDKVRDVALIKLDDLPADMAITTLPVRADWPAVGEDVYAIGAPISRRSLQDTVTKGIISAHRKDFRIFGTRVNLLQADVSIHGGNSGGPLLDQYGNIVGIAVAGNNNAYGDSVGGLNYFIPIGEAFARLDIHND